MCGISDESINFLVREIVGMTETTQGVNQLDRTAGSQLENIVLDDDDSDDERERKDKCC